ncbi:TonB-dependent receptor [Frateuria aurantia]
MAQSYLGGLYGKIVENSGVKIEVLNAATGYAQTLVPDTRGYFKLSGLSPGKYQVNLLRQGKVPMSLTVEVRAGANAPAMFAEGKADNAAQLAAVHVSAANPPVNAIDVSTVDKTQVWTSDEYNDLPLMSRDMRSVAAMQSGVTVNAAHGGASTPQFNGASADENRYFYNQFDATDGQNYDSPSTVPDEAIQSVQSADGGFGVKYGSATGGVVSANIKQGSNNFQAGTSLYFTPPTSSWLQSNAPNIYNPVTGAYSTRNDVSHNSGEMQENYYLSGAFIKDKLFYYVLATDTPPYRETAYGSQLQTTESQNNRQLLANITWNIAKGHTLDLMLSRSSYYSWYNNYSLSTPYEPGSASKDLYSWSQGIHSVWMAIANYQGQITDDLTVAVMGGFIKDRIYSNSSGQDPLEPLVESKDPVTGNTTTLVPGVSSVYQPTMYFKRGGRIDFEWTHFQDHDIKFGGELYDSTQGVYADATSNWTYDQCNTTSTTCDVNGVTLPSGSKYVYTSNTPYSARVGTKNWGFYLDDTWHFADNWILYGGVRHDEFTSQNPDGQTFLKLPYNSPRLGLAWDVHGDSSLKIGATAGRYASNIGLNYNVLAGTRNNGFTSTTTYYTYTGVGSDYIPTGLTQIGNVAGSSGTSVQVLNQYVSKNIKPNTEDQFSLYAQQQLGDNWTAGITAYFSKLHSLMNRFTAPGLVEQYLASIGYPDAVVGSNYLFNPGSALVIPVDLTGNGKLTDVTIPNSVLGYTKPRRKVYQLTMSIDHTPTDDQPWYLSASYTWRHMFGTVDGTTSYDQGTSGLGRSGYDDSWGAPGYTAGSGGDLNTDNRNNFKVYGYYKFKHSDWWGGALRGLRLGGDAMFMTGAPLSCLSIYPSSLTGSSVAAGSSPSEILAFYCGSSATNPLALTTTNRGHAGRLPSIWSLGIDIGYDWVYGSNKFSLDLKMDNVTNHQSVVERVNTYTNSDGSYDNLYGSASLYQTPRTSMMVFRWDFK